LRKIPKNLTDEGSSQHRITGGIQKAIESGRTEREYQYIICGADQPNDTAECFEIDTAHMGNGAVHNGAFGTSVLVVGVLSLLALPRELTDENGRADSPKGETESERIQEDDTCSGG